MRIAMLTHSTNPRGGVVHALELCEALAQVGHHPVLFAPDTTGAGFYRAAACETRPWPAAAAPREVAALVARRRAELLCLFTPDLCAGFDLFHAQDSISANALADLQDAGRIGAYLRTVHHLDDFADPELAALQARGVNAARTLFAVSPAGRAALAASFGRDATLIGNGVDTARFSPMTDAQDAALRARLTLGSGPVVLSLGGVEKRKNTLGILQGFRAFRAAHAQAVLVIAGGASLLDHSAYQREFFDALAQSGLPDGAVRVLGKIPQSDMPALYRLADMLAFPSLHEGFGLAVLEAMASGTPVLVPRCPPFTDYLTEPDAAWCDAGDIAGAMQFCLRHAAALRASGLQVAARWRWADVAAAHLPIYQQQREPAHA